LFKFRTVNVLNGPINSSLRQLSLPLAAGFILYILNSWVDKIYVSQLGDIEIAAVGVGETLRLFLFTLGVGFALGSSVVISRRIGEGETEKANESATQAMFSMFAYAIIVSVIFYFNIENIIRLLGYRGDLNSQSILYLKGIIIGIPFNFVLFQINAIVRSSGNTVLPMLMIAVTILSNAILSPLLIFDFTPIGALGIYGAGLATGISQWIGCGLALLILIMGYTPIKLRLKNFNVNFKLIALMQKKGIPTTLQYLTLSISRIVLIRICYLFGDEYVTAYTLGLSLDLFVFMPVFAMGVAMEIIAGQNRGANQIDRIFEYFNSSIRQIGFILIPMMFLVFFFGEHFAAFFTDDQKIIEETQLLLRITSFSYMFFAVGTFSTRIISGAGDTFRSFTIYILVLIFTQLPLAYILSISFEFGPIGIYFGIMISFTLYCLIGLIHLYKKKWVNITL